MRSAAVVKCAACMAPAVSQCRPEGSAQPFRPVCATSQCVAALIGLRLEEAQAALDAAQVRAANPSSTQVAQIVANARDAYQAASAEISKAVEKYNEGNSARDSPARLFIPGSYARFINTLVMQASAIAHEVHQMEPGEIDYASEYSKLRDKLQLFDELEQVARRIADTIPLYESASKQMDAIKDMKSVSKERLRKIMALVSTMNTKYPGSVSVKSAENGDFAADIAPFPTMAAVRQAQEMVHEQSAGEVNSASATLADVMRRQTGPSAYTPLWRPGYNDSFGKMSTGTVSIEAQWSFPAYIKQIVRRIQDFSKPANSTVESDLKRVVEDGKLLELPKMRLMQWIQQNTATSDSFYPYVKKLAKKRAAIEVDGEDPAKPPPLVFPRDLVTQADAAEMIAVLRHMYEVLIDRVYDSRKREADGGASDAKRAAAAASV